MKKKLIKKSRHAKKSKHSGRLNTREAKLRMQQSALEMAPKEPE